MGKASAVMVLCWGNEHLSFVTQAAKSLGAVNYTVTVTLELGADGTGFLRDPSSSRLGGQGSIGGKSPALLLFQ